MASVRRALGALATSITAVAFCVAIAAKVSDAESSAFPDASATLEPAPPIDMRAYGPYSGTGTSSISGRYSVPTKAFGRIVFFGSIVAALPDTPYTQYVAHMYRDAWFRDGALHVDPAVKKLLRIATTDDNARFSITGLQAGRYLVFSTVTDRSATSYSRCLKPYPGFDENGNAVAADVAVYCYNDVRSDELFVEDTVDVAAGRDAVATLEVRGEVVK